MLRSRATTSVFLVLVLLLAVGSVWGQVTTGKIAGSVQDPSGASVVGAAVRAINTGTGRTDATTTDNSGNYQFFVLQPGTYNLEVSLQGFKTFRRDGLEVQADRSLAVPVSLSLGQASEVVEVTAGTVLLDANTSTLGTTVDNAKILNLPVNGRNPLSLATLVPTVRTNGGFGGQIGGSWGAAAVSIGGGNALANGSMMDGMANDKIGDSGGSVGFLSQENMGEMKVITNAMAAEYGNTGGGIISVISKSGTNRYHGVVYEYLRNSALNANNFFNNASGRAIVPSKVHQFGGTYSGPIIRNRFFFHANYEKQISRNATSNIDYRAPSPLEREGDFSQTLGPNGQLVTIYDPLTTVTVNGSPVRKPFDGNRIPANRIGTAGKVIMGMFPQANLPGQPFTQANNLYQSGTSKGRRYEYTGKVDYNLTDNQQIAFRYGHVYSATLGANPFGNLLVSDGRNSENPHNSASLQYTNAIRPTLLLDAKVGFNTDGEKGVSPSTFTGGYDITKLGFPANLAPQLQITSAAPTGLFPCITITDVGGTGVGTCNGNQFRMGITWGNTINLTKVLSAHTIKAGWDRRWLAFFPSTLRPPTFGFTRGFTQGPNPTVASANAGYGLASFLLGNPASGSVPYGAIQAYSNKYHALFVQDDWKVTRKLTLNLGLRWELLVPVEERFNQLSIFDPSAAFPVNVPGMNLKGAIAFPGANGLGRNLTNPNYDHFGPRFGFAYQTTSKLVVRGGYGLIYIPLKGITFAAQGFSSTTNMQTSLDGGLTPYRTLSDPFPEGILLPTGNSLGGKTGFGQGVTGQLMDVNLGYSQQWNLTLQYSPMPNWMVEVAYLGNKGTHLLGSGRNLDQLDPQYLSLGNALNDKVPNPFVGLAPAGSDLSSSTITRQRSLQPYPQFSSVSGQYHSLGNSIYHAGYIKVEKRMSHGLTFSASYTYSKLIDALALGTRGVSVTGTANWYNLAAERSVSADDLRHRIVGSVTWQIPVFSGSTGLLNRALGGWQLNVLPTIESGTPISLTASGIATRPNVVPGQAPGVDDPTIAKWFNTSAFSIPAPFTYGNVSRNLPGVYSDGLISFNSSLFKDFKIAERYSLQFRLETFNTLNSVQFDTPGLGVGTSGFGIVTQQGNSPRNLQLGLRLNF